MNTGGVVAVAVVAAALGALAGGKLLAGKPEVTREDLAAVESKGRADREAAAKAHEEALSRLRTERDGALRSAEAAVQETAAARKEAEDANAALESVRAAAREGPLPAKVPPPAAAGPAAARFSFAEYDAALAKVDWKSVGESTRALVPLVQELRESARKGGQLNLENIGKIQQQNGALIKAASKIQAELPGSGINGSYTHPAFMVNALAATLDSAGLPLTASQAETLARLGREFTDREKSRTAGYDDRTYELQKVLDEAETKDQFFEQALGLLSAEQQEAVSPAAVRGLTIADMFSSGLMLQQHMAALPSKDRDSFVGQAERLLVSRAGFPEERREELQAAIKAWAAGLPDEWFTQETDAIMGVQPLMKVSLIEEMGRRQLPLLRQVAESMGVPEACAKSLRNAGIILVPFVKKGP